VTVTPTGPNRGPGAKHYGIRVELAPGNPMALPHLLGDEWVANRWYDDRAARDRALEKLLSGSPYFRKGDDPAVRYTPVDQ